MRQTHSLCFGVAFALLTISPATARVYNLGPYQGGAAAAQYNYQRYGETGYARDGDVRNTCFKLCSRDTNPCDPPEFKAADNRCNPFD